MRHVFVLCASILAGCQAIAGLSDLKVDRSAGMNPTDAAADGVKLTTGRSDMSTPARKVERLPDPARESRALDGGVKVDAAFGDVGGEAGRQAAGPRVAAAGAVALSPSVAGSGGTEDDAGIDSDQKLGNTNLRVSDILGYYSGDWGQMVLRKQDNEILGVYEYRDGAITGQINAEGVFVGWWTQSPSRTGLDAGEVEFRWSTIAGASIALDGRWRYGTDGDWLENWDILRVTDRSAPSYLTDRFDDAEAFKRHP